MVNTAVVILYKNCLFDIYRNISNFASRSAQQSYYAGLTKLKYNAVFNKIGDPILLDVDFETVLGYDRGEIQYNGVSYYFQVSDLRVNAQGATEISYIIDVWETMRYQYDLKLGSGQITRLGDPTDSELASYCRGVSYTPSYKNVEYYGNALNTTSPVVYCTIRDNDIDEIYITGTKVQIADIGRIGTMGIVKYALADLKQALSKDNLTVLSANYSSIDFTTNWTDIANTTTSYVTHPTINELTTTLVEGSIVNPVMSDVFTDYFISDERGNVIYTLPIFTPIDPILNLVANFAPSGCSIDAYISDGSSDFSYDKSYIVTIPMEPLDIYNDTWATYQAQQRQADIDSRNQQMNSQLMGSLANIGTGAVTGATLGSVVPGIGTAIGAVAGGITSAVSSLTGYASSAYNSPKEQAIQDNIHKKASDTLSLVGTGVNGSATMIFTNKKTRCGWGKKTVTTQDRMYIEDEIGVYGYIMDYPTSDVDSLIRDGPFQANVEVLGCPASWAAQVQNRIANGVYFYNV